jgi:hypothetical protein
MVITRCGFRETGRTFKQARSEPRSLPRIRSATLGTPLSRSSTPSRLLREKVQKLLREIDERYARLIRKDLQRNLKPHDWSGLTFEFLVRVVDHVCEGLPLAFPAAVAEAYLENPHAGNATSCQQCRYKLPPCYFKLCPACGGPVNF